MYVEFETVLRFTKSKDDLWLKKDNIKHVPPLFIRILVNTIILTWHNEKSEEWHDWNNQTRWN